MALPNTEATLQASAELTADFIRTLLVAPALSFPSKRTRLSSLEAALSLLDAAPLSALLDLRQEVCVHQSTDKRAVRHTVMSAAFVACITLEGPASSAQTKLPKYWDLPTPKLATRILNFFRRALEPASKTENEPRGRYDLQASLWRAIQRKKRVVVEDFPGALSKHDAAPPTTLLVRSTSTSTSVSLSSRSRQHDSPLDEAALSLYEAKECKEDAEACGGGDSSDRFRRRSLSIDDSLSPPFPPTLSPSVSLAAPSTPRAPGLVFLAVHSFVTGAPNLTDLLDAGCDADEYNDDGLTALHLLVQHGSFSSDTRLGMVQRLLDGGSGGRGKANINLPALKGAGNSALHMAAAEKDARMFLYLLQRGADPTLVNRHGANALYSLSTNLHSFSPYRPVQLEKVMRYLIEQLDAEVEAGSEAARKQRVLAEAMFALVVPPESRASHGAKSMDFSGQEGGQPSAAQKVLEILTTKSSSSAASPPPLDVARDLEDIAHAAAQSSFFTRPAPPGLHVFARQHIYELLDTKLNATLKEWRQAQAAVLPPVYRRQSEMATLSEGGFHRGVMKVLRPVILAELDDHLIPDLAAMCADFLI